MKERAQDVVHQRLEHGRSVAQPEQHHQKLVQPVVCAERHLGDVSGAHVDLVVARAKVQLGEELGAMEFVQQLINHRDRKSILDGDRV